jgi:uncharacterized protein YkwD
MRTPARRSVLAGLVLTLAFGLVPAPSPAAASTVAATTIAAAERTAFDLTNGRRTGAGLVTLKADPRLFSLARQRAEYMAAHDTFSHTQADGTTVFDLISAQGITWYGAGEIIAWNTAAALDYSASFAVKAWMDSPGHRAIIMSTGYNYVGFGLAISPTTGRRYWAGVYLKGPDRTGAWAKVASATSTVVDGATAKVTVKWSGNDTKLQVLTAGLRNYQAQKRTDGGAWTDYGTMTATSLTKTWARGHVYDIRVRASDKAGNWGAWNMVTVRP